MSTTTNTEKPLSWIKKVNEELFSLKNNSLQWPPFPWKEFEHRMKALFRLDSAEFDYREMGMANASQALAGLPSNALIFSINIQPVNDDVFFIIGENEAKGLMAALLGGNQTAAFFLEQDALFSFMYYLAAECLRMTESLKWMPIALRVSDQIVHKLPPLSDKNLMSEVAWILPNGTFFGRLIIPFTVYMDCVKKVEVPVRVMDIREADPLLVLDLAVEVGFSSLSSVEWMSVKTGDFIVLDGCFFDPDEKEGGAFLALNEGKPLFSGRFMDDGVNFKITGYLNQEVNMYNEDDEDEVIVGKGAPSQLSAADQQQRSQGLKQFPCRLTIEVGRIKMTLEEIMKLTPGSLIPLGTSPERGVDLVVNGTKVGQGELISLGDMLGVRVLKL
ncbi:Uncharacterized protein CLAVI_000289 [Candidatus Clavichlamydia salmonicola]|uniref:type III secretion system cytoplasmic ring protein SctQ n=1 Tax=Candidatus Clavichlamydia salmonicola TaxID=469812 RepID=UPI0018917060|nr:type III secretion system cytoplasmic ring protein SctQ [Candidatus Clavichlamydia salmonicola]MBF5050674.1 Uncharacterized protein [Candidatus Clavichlamydia salmonicola]